MTATSLPQGRSGHVGLSGGSLVSSSGHGPFDMLNNRPVPPQLQDRVERELEANEQIEWMEMPIPRFFTPTATGAFLFGIPWTAFALFWTASAAWGTLHTEGAGIFNAFPLFGVPFILIGFGLLSSPLWAYRRALGTVYVITDRRAITFDGGRTSTVRSYPPDRLQDVYRKERKDGTGDVIIARRAWRDSDGDRQTEELGFLRVRDAKGVETLLRRLADQVRRRADGERGSTP